MSAPHQSPVELDVRPLLARNRPPLPAILAAVARLEPGQTLCLIAPFEPVPLYEVLGASGFSHEIVKHESDVWVVHFSRDVPDTG
ncbi:hypothetical protein OPIT5_23200 [Opitutaceae bacterium TAV5]|nr:hypothetical protein OPIT5_23200 [Opitutaceae bacterium TAV5]